MALTETILDAMMHQSEQTRLDMFNAILNSNLEVDNDNQDLALFILKQIIKGAMQEHKIPREEPERTVRFERDAEQRHWENMATHNERFED